MKDFDRKWKDKVDSHESGEQPSEYSVRRMMDSLDKTLPQSKADKPDKIRTLRPIILKIAASIALIFTIGYITYSINNVEVIAAKKSQKESTLPDGSSVILNAESRLAYNKLSWNLTREVELNGEAFFEGEHGENFIVRSPHGFTRVLGTSFNVLDRADLFQVSCYTGKIRVSGNGSEVLLNPGEGLQMEGGSTEKFEFRSQSKADWLQGEFHFDEAALSIVIEELERQFAVEIDIPQGYAELNYTGFFYNNDLAQALRLVCEPLGLNYEIEDDQIILTPAGN